MRSSSRSAVAALAATAIPLVLAAQSVGEWPAYGRDAAGTRSSPLTQIDRDNVRRLAPTWTYRTGDLVRANESTRFEAPRSWWTARRS